MLTPKEPEEYRTVYIENLSQDWKEDEIKVRLEQVGSIDRLHIVRNSLGENTGKGKTLLSSYCSIFENR
jgi:hypothetical protein